MCCNHTSKDFSRIHSLLRRKSRHEGVFYKTVTDCFRTSLQGHRLFLGVNDTSLTFGNYDKLDPRGFHVWIEHRYLPTSFIEIPVICSMGDLIVADGVQAVFSKIRIRRQDAERVIRVWSRTQKARRHKGTFKRRNPLVAGWRFP